jgi:hypothetical protein
MGMQVGDGVGWVWRFCSRRVRGLAFFGVRCNGKPRPPRTCEGRPSRRKGRRFLTQSTIIPTKIRECLAAISLCLYLGTARLVVPDLKANQTDEGQPPEDEPAQSSDHDDKKQVEDLLPTTHW